VKLEAMKTASVTDRWMALGLHDGGGGDGIQNISFIKPYPCKITWSLPW